MNNLKISEAGKKFIQGHEGKINSVYIDPVGCATVGIGHLVVAGENFPHTLTDKQVYDLFDKDLKKFEDGVNKLVTAKINQNQFDALVSFSFNLGLGALKSSTLLRVLNSEDDAEAAKQFLRWDKAGNPPKPLAGLTRRRKEESELFLRPPQVSNENDYNDIKGHWAKDSLKWGLDNGLISGYEDGTIKPDNLVSRAELLTILKNYDNHFNSK